MPFQGLRPLARRRGAGGGIAFVYTESGPDLDGDGDVDGDVDGGLFDTLGDLFS